ncbi:MAG: XF1762 family protein [Dysosmobacter sp.]
MTTNYDTEALIDRMTPRESRDSMTARATIDRLMEMCRGITLTGQSWRSEVIEIRETTLREANAYVEELHRHHGKVVGHKWSLAAYKRRCRLCGVAIVGRPTGRYLDNGSTLEVTRLCTDGTRNACSALYAACARRAKRKATPKSSPSSSRASPGQVSGPQAGRWRPQKPESPDGTR